MQRYAGTLWLCLAAFILNGWAEAATTNVLVRNVSLIDAGGSSESRTVNILIRDGRLDLISKDPIPVDGVTQKYEAAKAVVLGKLILEEPASFLIVDGEPRETGCR